MRDQTKQCDKCPHIACVAVYPPKHKGILLCTCCYADLWPAMELSDNHYTIVPLDYRAVTSVYRPLWLAVEEALDMYRRNVWEQRRPRW